MSDGVVYVPVNVLVLFQSPEAVHDDTLVVFQERVLVAQERICDEEDTKLRPDATIGVTSGVTSFAKLFPPESKHTTE